MANPDQARGVSQSNGRIGRKPKSAIAILESDFTTFVSVKVLSCFLMLRLL
jgi:hypothetical protein